MVLIELAFATIEMVVMMPLDTIRKRLHVQPGLHSDGESRTVVEVSPTRYSSGLDCGWQVTMVEGSGIAGLYRGFRTRWLANVMIGVLQLLTLLIDEGDL